MTAIGRYSPPNGMYSTPTQRNQTYCWDGAWRVDEFLIDHLHLEDNIYHREVSRLIFFGAMTWGYDPASSDYLRIGFDPSSYECFRMLDKLLRGTQPLPTCDLRYLYLDHEPDYMQYLEDEGYQRRFLPVGQADLHSRIEDVEAVMPQVWSEVAERLSGGEAPRTPSAKNALVRAIHVEQEKWVDVERNRIQNQVAA